MKIKSWSNQLYSELQRNKLTASSAMYLRFINIYAMRKKITKVIRIYFTLPANNTISRITDGKPKGEGDKVKTNYLQYQPYILDIYQYLYNAKKHNNKLFHVTCKQDHLLYYWERGE